VKLRAYELEARLPKISTSAYLIDIIIYHLPIELLNAKSSYGRITYPLPLDIAYIKTYD
jgi:hypothetical protein